MSAQIIDGKAIAKKVRIEVKQQAAKLIAQGLTPGLATVLVGEDPASATYVRSKQRIAKRLGLHTVEHKLPADIRQAQLTERIDRLVADPAIHGVLVQLPLPPQLSTNAVLEHITPAKDVDGLLPDNLGRLAQGHPRLVACTPAGCLRLLDEIGCELEGAHAVVVGRSNIVGKPMAHLLLARHCTVTMCHSRSRGLDAIVASADVLIAAVGKARMIPGAWIKPGATVIDVGINRLGDGSLCGDVDFASACERAGAITPVPGGVGPMTIAMLMANTVRAARLSQK